MTNYWCRWGLWSINYNIIILLSHWVVDLTWHIMISWKYPLLNNALTCVSILIQVEWEKGDWFDCVEDSVKLMERSWDAMFWQTEFSQRNYLGCLSLSKFSTFLNCFTQTVGLFLQRNHFCGRFLRLICKKKFYSSDFISFKQFGKVPQMVKS